MKKLISIILILFFFCTNSVYALGPSTRLDRGSTEKTIIGLLHLFENLRTFGDIKTHPSAASLSQLRDHLAHIIGDPRIIDNMELALDPGNKALFLYSKNTGLYPGIIYCVYIPGESHLEIRTEPVYSNNFGGIQISVYPETEEIKGIIDNLKTTDIALTDKEIELLNKISTETTCPAFQAVLDDLFNPITATPTIENTGHSILEINARAWKGFRDISCSDLKRIRKLGFDTIWLMGIWQISQCSTEINTFLEKDEAGSAYAVTDYKINPELGTEDEFLGLCRMAKSLGLRIIVDFVPNHMAMDSPLIEQHPDWFMPHWGKVSPDDLAWRSKDGVPMFFRHPVTGRLIAHGAMTWDTSEAPWLDTAQLNLTNPELRKYMIEKLKYIARLTLSGGVRCDTAMLATKDHIRKMWYRNMNPGDFDKIMPTEFWSEIIEEVRRDYPNFLFLAEVYWGLEGFLQGLGFNITYDKHLYDLLVQGNIRELKSYIERAPKEYLANTIHFLANHDEQNPLDIFSTQQHKAAVIIMGATSGNLLYYMDQTEGMLQQGNAIHIPPYKKAKKSSRIRRFYRRIIPIFSDLLFRKGEFHLLKTDGSETDNLFACQRQFKDESAIVLVNYSNTQITTTVNPANINLEEEYLMTDLITGRQRVLSGYEIVEHTVSLSPWGYHIFRLSPAHKESSSDTGSSIRKRIRHALKSLGDILRRRTKTEGLDRSTFADFYKKLTDRLAQGYPTFRIRPEEELLTALEEKDTERYYLLSALKEDHIIGLEEIETIKRFAMIVEEVSSGLDIHLWQKKLIVEILAADFLSLTSTVRLVNSEWLKDKEMPLIPYLAPLPNGIIIQKFSDLFGNLELKNGEVRFNQMSPGLKEWIDMLKRHHGNMSSLRFGFIVDNLGDYDVKILKELLEKLTGLNQDFFYFGREITDITLQVDTENLVYLGEFSTGEQEQLKQRHIKFLQKNNTGLPIELNFCLNLLWMETIYGRNNNLSDEVLAIYVSFVNNLVKNELISESTCKEIVNEVKSSGVLKLPEIRRLKDILRELAQETITINFSA